MEFGPINGHKVVNQLANNATFYALTGSIKGKENQRVSNFYLDIKPCSSYYNDPEVEVFWTEFAKE